MKKLFKLILNTIPRPLLIRASYGTSYYRFSLRGTNFWSIDGKKLQIDVALWIWNTATMYFLQVHFLWKTPFIVVALMNKLIFYFTKRKSAFAPEQAFYKLFRNQKNLDYTTDLFRHFWM
jgi:hypothetical protein